MTSVSAIPHQRFAFDTVFDGASVVTTPRPKRSFTPEEVEAVRAEAFCAGERSAMAAAAEAQARAVGTLAAAVEAAMPALRDVASRHREEAAEVALATGRAIADAALDLFPAAPITAALSTLAREIEAEPRLIVSLPAVHIAALEPMVHAALEAIGFGGTLVVRPETTMPPAAFVLDWGDGRAAFDPSASAARVAEALHNALEAERLHAEPLTPLAETLP